MSVIRGAETWERFRGLMSGANQKSVYYALCQRLIMLCSVHVVCTIVRKANCVCTRGLSAFDMCECILIRRFEVLAQTKGV